MLSWLFDLVSRGLAEDEGEDVVFAGILDTVAVEGDG